MDRTTTLERDETELVSRASTQPTQQVDDSSRLKWLALVGGVLFLGFCGYIALGGGTDESANVSTQQAFAALPAAQDPVDDPVPAAAPLTDEAIAAEPAESAPASEEPIAAEEPAVEEETEPVAEEPIEVARAAVFGPDSPEARPGAPEIYSVMSGGKLFLRGVVPSSAIETQVVQAVGAIMGASNVVSEYSIDPTRELVIGEAAPVYIADSIQFESGSAEIAPDFYPLIGIAPVMLTIQPDVVLTITGHTDNVGGAATNLALSQARVDAVRDWIIGRGGDPERIIAIGEGASDPIASNETEEGQQANRRVEFLIEGFDFTIGS